MDDDADLIDALRQASHNSAYGQLMFEAADALEVAQTGRRVALWMITHSYATGHSDIVEDMLAKLVAQVREAALKEEKT